MAPHWRALLFLLVPALLSSHLGRGEALLLVLALSWAFLKLEGRGLPSLGLAPGGRWAREWLGGIGAGLGLMALPTLCLWALGGFRWEADPAFRGVHLLNGAVLFTLVALHEECLFRGYPFQRLIESWGPWPAQLAMALLFALAHWGNPGLTDATRPLAILNLILASVLLGLCYLRTRSLALPIGVHLGWNWAQGCLLGFPVSGTELVRSPWKAVLQDRPTWLTGGSFGIEASALCTLICLGGILSLSLWGRRTQVS